MQWRPHRFLREKDEYFLEVRTIYAIVSPILNVILGLKILYRILEMLFTGVPEPCIFLYNTIMYAHMYNDGQTFYMTIYTVLENKLPNDRKNASLKTRPTVIDIIPTLLIRTALPGDGLRQKEQPSMMFAAPSREFLSKNIADF